MPKPRRTRLSPALVSLGFGLAVGVSGCGSGLTGPERLTLFIAPQLVECQAVGPRMCMQVRERPDAEWEFLFAPIEGFEFEAGFFYELWVERHRVENPPADGSRFRYVLLQLVNKVPDA